jgi:hypothetical protein
MTHSTKDNRPNEPHVSPKRLKERIDRAMRTTTLASTLVAVIAALAALWSGYEAHKTRIHDERPFIGVDIAPRRPGEAADPWLVHTTVTAYGKLPSMNVRVWCVKIRAQGEETNYWHPEKSYLQYWAPYVLPNHSFALQNCPVVDGASRVQNTVFELVLVEYQDTEGNAYQTPFCGHFLYSPNGSSGGEQCGSLLGLPEFK